jgi:signal transduction histidine kinase
LNQQRASYDRFDRLRDGNVLYQMREVFGTPKVLDIAAPLDRNGQPFLIVHVGVRSTFLRAAYEPFLRAAMEFVLFAILACVAVAALLSTLALRPLQAIGEQLERLTRGNTPADVLLDQPLLLDAKTHPADPVGRVNLTIDRLGRQMRTREEGYTALQTNLDQMLDTLRDGVLLFAPDRRAVMVSDAVAQFLDRAGEALAVDDMVGMRLEEIFPPDTTLGAAVSAAFERGAQMSAETVTLEDGRQVQISLDRIGDGHPVGGARNGQGGLPGHAMGTLLTLRDTGSALELEQELEVARRLAAIGRLTANVGHEVKNPINAMVVHLELLRGKLASSAFDRASAQKHVEILADEMHRLDRVVETLADFSRPMDLDLREQDLRRVIDQTLELAGAELKENGVRIESESPPLPIFVRVDAELMRQAFLNLLLNAMQAMPSGGLVRVSVRRDQRVAIVEIADNGAGIPAAVLPRIFDLYFTTKPRGSGIGLAMTYRIVQLHGGSMSVRSNTDPASQEHGTTFTLHIPISASHANESRKQSGRLTGHPDLGDPDANDEEAPSAVAPNMERKEIV